MSGNKTHDEILREHGARYAQMSPEEKAKQSEARAKLERERLAAEARRLNQPLSELTLGDLIEAIKEALNQSVVPKLEEIVEAVQHTGQK
jgi:vacuolar-type H+-ATPase subunit E/Vma4